MAKVIHVEGFEAYKGELEKNKGKIVFALFSGSKDANGGSWCPDCVTGKSYDLTEPNRWITRRWECDEVPK